MAPSKKLLVPKDLTPTTLDWEREGPSAYRLKRTDWTRATLAVFLYEQTSIRVRKTAMGYFCDRSGMPLTGTPRPDFTFSAIPTFGCIGEREYGVQYF